MSETKYECPCPVHGTYFSSIKLYTKAFLAFVKKKKKKPLLAFEFPFYENEKTSL
jgi:hypothetical protein